MTFSQKIFCFIFDTAKSCTLKINKRLYPLPSNIWNLNRVPNGFIAVYPKSKYHLRVMKDRALRYTKLRKKGRVVTILYSSIATKVTPDWSTSTAIKALTSLNYTQILTYVLDNALYYCSQIVHNTRVVWKKTLGEGYIYLRGLVILFGIDACLTDDEPLWEPVEWSLVQSWILFIFLFAWIAENLISSRYGSYTGRDKRVWFSWYKTFWLIELWYVLSLGAASLFVMVPFYYEITYTTSFIVSWWNWYSRVFFFKFVSSYTIILFIAYYLQINLRYWNWKKNFALIILINIFLSYLLYVHFIMSFFGYFTDRNWYNKARLVDYIQMSHEPNKWSWSSPNNRDNFTYHKSTTVFWFKNDGPFASAFLFFHFFFFMALFTLYLFWLTLIRRVYTTQEITYTYTTYCVSALKQFFYFFFLLYIFIFLSFIMNYWRTPIEHAWMVNSSSWVSTFALILRDYPNWLWSWLSTLLF